MPRIMLVDDDYSVKLALEASLISMGYDVVGQADSGEQAVEMARELKPDVIFMDIVLPGHMDGISAAEKIRSELEVAIVFLTGYGDLEYVERAKQVEPFGYVMKPWTDEEIRASVEIAFYKKEAEAAIRGSEKKYRSLFENSPIGIAVLDGERNILDFNDAMLEINGYTREDMGTIANTSEYYYNPDDKIRVSSELSKKGFVKEIEVKFKRKDGTPYDALLSMRLVEIEGQSLWHAMIQDISDRKRAEDALQKSHREWEGIFHAIGHPTLILNADHRMVHANKATEKATGKPETDLIGKRCYEIFHNTDEPPEGCPCEKMIASGHLETVEMEIKALGGTFLVSCTPMLDDKGHIEKVIHIATNITDQKQKEAALRESEERFRTVANFTYDWEYWVAPDGHHIYVSPSCERITGYSSDEFINDHELFQKIVHPDDQSVFASHICEVEKEKGAFAFDFRIITRSGEERWISHACQPVYGIEGKYLGQRASNRDISERKRIQDVLQKSHKIEAIGTLSGGIAHDYNNLLAIIMGNLSIAQEETDPHSVIAELLHEVEQASLKAKDLTHQFLTLSDGGHPAKMLGPVESLLKEIPEQVQAHDGIEYAFSIQNDLWSVEYDPSQIEHAIRNLLMNAVEAMPQGGCITIQAENQAIDNKDKESPLLLNEGKYVRISIKDEGSGISEEHMDKIFDPYFSTKDRGTQKGMGMGMAVAQSVVQKHDGHIMINSTTGAGTTVTIYLPAAEEKGEPETAKQAREDITPSTSSDQTTIKRILVMDDEEGLRNLGRKMLQRLGYEVETVKDGDEAIETYKKHMGSGEPFDGVILDLTIKGGMGGAQAIKELIKIDPGVKAIVCSGYFNDPVLANYEEHGFRGAMAKPYQKADLEIVLKKVLR